MAAANSPPGATLRKLFGGAMECLLPAAYVDVSDLRQVPDHQEAFVSREDGVSIVIEVLSFETEIPSDSGRKDSGGGGGGGGASARHFFDDLAAANGASRSTVDFCGDMTDSIMPKLPAYAKAALVGRQTVAKFREDAPPEAVRLYLVNVRLPNVGTDLLITVNVPYPDEDAAARSTASADCFLSTATGVAVAEASPAPAQAAAAGDDAGASSVVADVAEEAKTGGQAPVREALLGGDGVVGAPQESAREASGAGADVGAAAAEEGSEGVMRELSSRASSDDASDAGVKALRSLVHSFAILDWSLFG